MRCETLHALGCGTVSFGAETADTDLLLQAAELLNSLPMKGESGSPHLSYAARRQEELSKVNKQAAVLLDNPNNTLAVEYCRFLLPLGMRPLAVLRQGAAHDAQCAAQRLCLSESAESAFARRRFRVLRTVPAACDSRRVEKGRRLR